MMIDTNQLENLIEECDDLKEFSEDDILGDTEIDYNIYEFYDTLSLGNRPLETAIPKYVEVSYSPKQNFVMLEDNHGNLFCLRSEKFKEISDNLKKMKDEYLNRLKDG